MSCADSPWQGRPRTPVHQEEFGELKLDCIHEETEWCSTGSAAASPLQELYLSASELRRPGSLTSVSQKLDKTSAPDASECCTTAHTHAQPSGPGARLVDDARSEFVLCDQDFLCCPEDLAAARNMWQPAASAGARRIPGPWSHRRRIWSHQSPACISLSTSCTKALLAGFHMLYRLSQVSTYFMKKSG